jgi:hypothetical protein
VDGFAARNTPIFPHLLRRYQLQLSYSRLRLTMRPHYDMIWVSGTTASLTLGWPPSKTIVT